MTVFDLTNDMFFYVLFVIFTSVLLNMCSSSSRDTETFVASESCFESLMLRSLMKYFLAPLCCSSLHLNF
jgi:hypothetical protein